MQVPRSVQTDCRPAGGSQNMKRGAKLLGANRRLVVGGGQRLANRGATAMPVTVQLETRLVPGRLQANHLPLCEPADE